MKTNIKNTVVYCYLVTLLISLFNKYIYIVSSFDASEYVLLNTFEIKGVNIVILCSSVFIFSYLRKIKILYYISFAGAIAGYIYSFLGTYNVLKYDGIGATINLEVGFYLYTLAFILLVLHLFFKTQEKKVVTQDNPFIKETENIDKNDYLFSEFVMGIKEINYNTFMLLANDYNKKIMNIRYKLNGNPMNISINHENIKSIAFVSKVIMNKVPYKPEDNEHANFLLSTLLFSGNPLSFTISKSLLDSWTPDEKSYNFNNLFELTITLENNQVLVFETFSNPEFFINKFYQTKNIV